MPSVVPYQLSGGRYWILYGRRQIVLKRQLIILNGQIFIRHAAAGCRHQQYRVSVWEGTATLPPYLQTIFVGGGGDLNIFNFHLVFFPFR